MTRLTLEKNENILIRQLGINDAKDVYSIIKTADNYSRNWIDKSVLTKTIDDVKVFLMEEELRLNRQNEILFTVSDKLGFCGIAGLHSTNKANNKTEIVLWLSNRTKNIKNYTDITAALLKYGFNEMRFNRIQCKSVATDFTLIGVFKKLGLKFEGTEKAGLLIANKTYVNLSVFAIIKAEYVEQSKFIIRASRISQRKNINDNALQ